MTRSSASPHRAGRSDDRASPGRAAVRRADRLGGVGRLSAGPLVALRASDLVGSQRALGNQAVVRGLLAERRPAAGPRLQRAIQIHQIERFHSKIGIPDDAIGPHIPSDKWNEIFWKELAMKNLDPDVKNSPFPDELAKQNELDKVLRETGTRVERGDTGVDDDLVRRLTREVFTTNLANEPAKTSPHYQALNVEHYAEEKES